MPQQAWNAKRERQYKHIKESQEERGVPEATAQEIAARTVNKERARAGESREASPTSLNDISSGRRGACALTVEPVVGRANSSIRRRNGAAFGGVQKCRRVNLRTL
jgi:hypothetical protein